MYLFNLKAVFRIRFFLTDPDPDLDPTQKPKADPDPKYCLKEHKSGTILFLYRSCNFMYREEIQTCLFFPSSSIIIEFPSTRNLRLKIINKRIELLEKSKSCPILFINVVIIYPPLRAFKLPKWRVSQSGLYFEARINNSSLSAIS